MLRVKWIIENFSDSEDYLDLIQAVRNSGRDCILLDKKNRFEFDYSLIKNGDLVLFVGSLQLAEKLKNELKNRPDRPVIFYTKENYLCSKYYPLLNEFLFNDKYAFVRLSTLKSNKFEYYAKFGKEALIFVRPDRGDKPFTGQLLDLQDFDRFWENKLACDAEDHDLIIVSTPKEIVGEFRFVCCGGDNPHVIAHSTYNWQGQITKIQSVPGGAIDLCNKILNYLNPNFPDQVFCVDVCLGKDEKFYLLEMGAFSTSGLYATNKENIVKEVSKIIENKKL